MWTDDTRVTVLGGDKGSFKGYFWTYIGDAEQPYHRLLVLHSRQMWPQMCLLLAV